MSFCVDNLLDFLEMMNESGQALAIQKVSHDFGHDSGEKNTRYTKHECGKALALEKACDEWG